MSPPYYSSFRIGIECLFNNWTALQLAVEQGMGGQQGRQLALEMIDYVSQFCCQKDNVDNYDIEQLLEDIMDDKFNTICEDESPQELSLIIYRFLQMCRSNNVDQMLTEVAKLPKCNLWLCKPQVVPSLPIQPDEIVQGDDEGVEQTEDSTNNAVANNSMDEPMEEDVEPGWSVVRTRRR